jgi:abortive infection bacteriophage resistance protein
MLYRGMMPTDRRAVADPLGLHHKRLEDWLHVLTYVRNVCAHHSRLWNRELAIRPATMAELEWRPPLLPRLDRVFAILLILSYLLQRQGNGAAWRTECTALLAPMAAEPRWLVAMGMPPQWLQHPHWT